MQMEDRLNSILMSGPRIGVGSMRNPCTVKCSPHNEIFMNLIIRPGAHEVEYADVILEYDRYEQGRHALARTRCFFSTQVSSHIRVFSNKIGPRLL